MLRGGLAPARQLLSKSLRNMVHGNRNTSARPVVAVIGTTGVGKSQLAVELARYLTQQGGQGDHNNGLILSADSMQLYKGLDVITNKVNFDEMGGIEHWGLDIVSPGQGGSWEVGRWCGEAEKKIAALPSNTLPIICGGTHYFIQHFLFPPDELSIERSDQSSSSIETSEDKGKGPVLETNVRWTPPCPRPPTVDLDPELDKLLDTFWTSTPSYPASINIEGREKKDANVKNQEQAGPSRSRPTLTSEHELLSLHRLLIAVDPKEGARWHWRDGRKVRRGLERWWERGIDVIAIEEDTNGPKGKDKGRRARFRTLIFWVYEPLETLRPRLDKRVDRMVENGLLREIAELRAIAERVYGSAEGTDHTEGIFQSIGYKEFAALSLPQPDPQSDPLFPAMLARTKLSTHQYAKSQLKWITKQLLPAVREAKSLGGEVEVYVVNGGEEGVNPALEVLKAFLCEKKLPSSDQVGHQDASTLLACLKEREEIRVPDTADRQNINARKDCEACSKANGLPYSVSLKDWEYHLKSKIHRRSTAAKVDKKEWIEAQKAKGEAKRAEREQLAADIQLHLQHTNGT